VSPSITLVTNAVVVPERKIVGAGTGVAIPKNAPKLSTNAENKRLICVTIYSIDIRGL